MTVRRHWQLKRVTRSGQGHLSSMAAIRGAAALRLQGQREIDDDALPGEVILFRIYGLAIKPS